MSILEPRSIEDADDPLLDAVLGFCSFARRARAAIEELAPGGDDSLDGPDEIPETFVAFLLGIVSTTDTLARVLEETCPPLDATPVPSQPAPSRESLWR